MAVTKQIWVNYIKEALYADNAFLNTVVSEDGNVINGTIVHKPQQLTQATVVRNRSTLPATVVKRNDGATVYVLAEYTTDPTLIPNIEKYELSYDKMQSVLGDHVANLNQEIAEWMIYDWINSFARTGSDTTPAASIIRTTGAATAAHLSTATGNRKLFLKEDLQKARTQMNKDNIPKNDRYALVSSDMLDQLMQDADLKQRDSALELDMRNGSIGRLYGFELLERSSTARYSNAATPLVKAPTATESASDNDTVLCYQRNSLEKAIGTLDFFEDLKNPTYYGDIYSALVMAGGQKRRLDGKGVISIVQDSAA